MSLIIIPKQEMDNFVWNVSKQYRVAGPGETNGQYAFYLISDHAELKLDYLTTILPSKKYLLLPNETLFLFNFNKEDMGAIRSKG